MYYGELHKIRSWVTMVIVKDYLGIHDAGIDPTTSVYLCIVLMGYVHNIWLIYYVEMCLAYKIWINTFCLLIMWFGSYE